MGEGWGEDRRYMPCPTGVRKTDCCSFLKKHFHNGGGRKVGVEAALFG